MPWQDFFARGKLLISGEYLVLEGAEALAIPTPKGHHLRVSPSSDITQWESINFRGETWFSAQFDRDIQVLDSSDSKRARFIQKLLQGVRELKGKALPPLQFESLLEFPENWGLGSSSSLTHMLAQCFEIDPFALFFKTQNGSGYDIACAGSDQPIVYQLKNGRPTWRQVKLPAIFNDCFLVYLKQKQDSREEVKRFRSRSFQPMDVEEVSAITRELLELSDYRHLQDLLKRHELLMSGILQRPTVQQQLFPDFKGTLKSLGAWGGDFIMAVGSSAPEYFNKKGFPDVFSFRDFFGARIISQ